MNKKINIAASLMGIAIAALIFGGCSMCCDTYSYDYPTFGGKHQRSDPAWGRVGSIFSDPGMYADGPSADSNLQQIEVKPRIEPTGDENLPMFDDSSDPNQNGNGENLPDPDRQPQPDDTARKRNWKSRPLRSEWR